MSDDFPGLDVHAVAEVYRENKRLRAENERLQRALKWAKRMSHCLDCTDGLCGLSRCQDDDCSDGEDAEDCVHCGLAEALGEVPADECIMAFAAKDGET